MRCDDLRRMDRVEFAVVLFLFGVLVASAMVIFVLDFDRIFPPTPPSMRSAETRAAVRLASASGALDHRLEAVDNPLKPAGFPVSNFLDIDQASKRQASKRRP